MTDDEAQTLENPQHSGHSTGKELCSVGWNLQSGSDSIRNFLRAEDLSSHVTSLSLGVGR